IGSYDQIADVLARTDASGPPLRGIFHLAGVLQDGLVVHQDASSLENVMHAKARGAWNLHRLSLDRTLDHFVLFSSAAALFWSGGESNYAAANAFLDGLAELRVALGLPALSLQWGPWKEIGLISRDGLRTKHVSGLGLSAWETKEALRQLDRVVAIQGVV